MRYNSESLEITLVISGNVLLFKDIKISLGLFITARKIPALFRENRYQEVSTTVNKAAFIMYATGGGRGFFFQRLVFLYPPPKVHTNFQNPPSNQPKN